MTEIKLTVNVKGAERNVTISTTEADAFLREYGVKQWLADAAAGKEGDEAEERIRGRMDKLKATDWVAPVGGGARTGDPVVAGIKALLRTAKMRGKGKYKVDAIKEIGTRSEADAFIQAHFGPAAVDKIVGHVEAQIKKAAAFTI